MTSRERVVTTLGHREPDSIPIDLGGTMCSSLTRGASENLRSYLNVAKVSEGITNPLSDSVDVTEEILSLFGVDFRTVRMGGPDREDEKREEESEEIEDEFGTTWKKADYDYVPVIFSYGNASISDLKKMAIPDPYNPGRVRGIRLKAERLRETTDFAIIADFVCGGPFEQAQRIRGFEQFLVDLYSDKQFAMALLELLTDNAIGFWDAMLTEVGEYVDVVCQGDDLGMQTGLMISPSMYREMVKPCHKRLFEFIRSKTNAAIWLHSCGSVYEIIPDFIEVGVEALNPIQVSAENMDLEKLKKEFGKDITFWGGGIDIQKLPFLTREEIAKEVNTTLDVMSAGGGYVFAASHNILPDTPGESIYTAFTTAFQRRRHGITNQQGDNE